MRVQSPGMIQNNEIANHLRTAINSISQRVKQVGTSAAAAGTLQILNGQLAVLLNEVPAPVPVQQAAQPVAGKPPAQPASGVGAPKLAPAKPRQLSPATPETAGETKEFRKFLERTTQKAMESKPKPAMYNASQAKRKGK